MSMPVRFPRIDFSDIKPHWAPNIAFCQDRNATSIIPTPVEPWLIKLLQEVKPLLPADDEALHADIQAFIGQESQHFRQHRQFNKVLIDAGYPRLAEFEAELAADLERFTRTRSLKFRLAYADGFESLGAVAGGLWFDHSEEMIGGLDNAAIRLWKWHMAEEFEHREVCFQVFRKAFARGLWGRIVNGYFYRIYGFVYAMWHLRRFSAKASAYMLEIDRAGMNPAEQARLEQDIKAFRKFNRRVFLKPLLANFLPWYDPGRKPVPKGLFEYLARFDKGGEWTARRAG
ncbi:metal-dependent hydrolase [Niveispirillum fermenti]|uniref:metal-dependent hydrolase n=1 Tax=Niveispirillum fermenti TaxID=1233113 RepID=UPI003A8BA65C